MKNSNDTIGNRTRYLPACSAVPQTTSGTLSELAKRIHTCTAQCTYFNPLNAELNLICHLLALLGAHHILHISGIRVKQYEQLASTVFPWSII